MEDVLILKLTNQQIEVVYRSLLDMQAKYSLPVIREIEDQVKAQTQEGGSDDDGNVDQKDLPDKGNTRKRTGS